MAQNKMTIRKGDTVKVISGKDRGKTGKVLRSVPEKSRVVVEKVNLAKKAMRPTQQNPQGGITTIEAPLCWCAPAAARPPAWLVAARTASSSACARSAARTFPPPSKCHR